MPNDKKTQTGDLTDEALQQELGRAEERHKKADTHLVDDMAANRNVSGSSTFEEIAEEDDRNADKKKS